LCLGLLRLGTAEQAKQYDRQKAVKVGSGHVVLRCIWNILVVGNCVGPGRDSPLRAGAAQAITAKGYYGRFLGIIPDLFGGCKKESLWQFWLWQIWICAGNAC
jgi:hypothetical protein